MARRAARGTAALRVEVLGRPPRGVRSKDVRSALRAAAHALRLGRAELAVRFASDRTVRRFNRVYRRQDRTTDVLSFPLGERISGDVHLGDLLISRRRAEVQARASGLSARREVEELVLHGLLHLLGYDHETDQGEMDRLELRLRRQLLKPGALEAGG